MFVNDTDYQLGKSPELTSSGGNWALKLGAMAAGSYAISAKVGDGDQQSVMSAEGSAAQLVVAAVEAPKTEPLPLPTITSVNTDDKATMVTGTWAEGKANSLEVGVDSRIYTLGKSKELTSSQGVWTLAIPPLAAGNHSIGAIESDGKQNVATGKATNVEVAPPPPPPPPPPKPPAAATVQNIASEIAQPKVAGTWPAVNGNHYQVELDGVTHTLGKDYDLTTDTNGKWTLVPLKPLVNGTYDVVMKVTGADGQVTSSVGKGAVVVNVPPPPPPPPPEQPYNCVAALATTAAAFPVRFEFNHDDLSSTNQDNVSHYADILKDARCQAVHMQVTGHADYIGSDAYNMELSERRANTVTGLLSKEGVDASRISSLGEGKTKPLDPAHSNDARAKNRRVEFNAQ